MFGGIYMKLAWRNVLRNKRRTFIAGIAIGVGLAALISMDALIIGMEKNMIKSATGSFMGEGQIHREDFRKAFEVERTIADLEQVVAGLEQEPLVENFTLRTLAFGMISSPANVSSVSMVGVDPSTEPYLSEIDDVMVEGSYFDGEGDISRQILIGAKLAELLEVGLGDRVVMTVAQAETGDLAQEMFRISGIYYFKSLELDQGMAFVRLDKAQQMLGLEGRVHQIALKFHDSNVGRDGDHPFWSMYSQNGNEALSWTRLMPTLESVLDLSQWATLILGVILFAVVALGIINTLFMSLYERMFEFGVLRAVGTRPVALGRLILFEAGALALIAICMGMALGFIITYLLSTFGIDYSGIEYAGVTFRKLLYPVMQPRQFIEFPIYVFLFTVLVGLYPATYAARLTPARAMRKSF
ncbi:MAG: ABC transporter permease [Candidatus Zixiibacteriota bacterium]|nr:MAG: ABC transporter permease [candidate division Zixibacteria bacterium]